MSPTVQGGLLGGVRVARSVLAGIAALVLLVGLGGPARAASVPVLPSQFVLSGAGFGHGVGMSQYGAYAQALAGRGYDQILQTYYPGTTVSDVTDNYKIKVGLTQASPSLSMAVCPVSADPSASLQVSAGSSSLTVRPGQLVSFTAGWSSSGTIVAVKVTGTPSGTSTTSPSPTPSPTSLSDVPVTTTSPIAVSWTGTTYLAGAPAVVVLTGTTTAGAPDCASVTVGGVPSSYRFGHMLVFVSPASASTSPRMALVNELGLGTEYVDGIAEMPSSWGVAAAGGASGEAALQAQAIAARGYALRRYLALASASGGVNRTCLCHVLPTTSDQVFVGWRKIADPTYGSYWASAVSSTENPTAGTGKVVTYNGAVATTTYFSSDAGRTESVSQVWGSSQASYPYLVSVADPWSTSTTTGNPYLSWTRSYSQAAMASAFALPDVVNLAVTSRTTGGSAATIVATSSSGATATLTGAELRSALSAADPSQTLPSLWLSVAGQAKRAGLRWAGADRYATAVAVSRALFGATPPAVVLANGTDAHLVDGLVAGPLARVLGGPLLLVSSTDLPASTAAELTRLAPAKVFVIGGTGAIPDSVLTAVKALLPAATVSRLAGADRYATAAAVAGQIMTITGPRPDVIVASGAPGHLVDALAVGGPAGALARPVLLTDPTTVPKATVDELKALGAQRTIVVGGTAAVSDAVLAALPAATRLAGADRFATATAVASALGSSTADSTVLAGGDNAHIVDALAAGATGQTILLTGASSLPSVVSGWLAARQQVSTIDVVGGTAAVSDAVMLTAQNS